ncbi:hypothetical protein Tco_0954430 [Tanacetum coccineum]|uniref:Uncharacterized protein n=1 Tax=Tanacetum coccineum TaxID=301880 RepID=A0ABQ5E2R4_9ASTR
MNPLISQQRALDDALVAPDDRVKIGRCNMRIDPNKTQKETTYQVVPDTLKLSPCYNAFLITVDVKIGIEVFHEVLQICPRLPNQVFVEPPSREDTVSFIKEISYRGC